MRGKATSVEKVVLNWLCSGYVLVIAPETTSVRGAEILRPLKKCSELVMFWVRSGYCARHYIRSWLGHTTSIEKVVLTWLCSVYVLGIAPLI